MDSTLGVIASGDVLICGETIEAVGKGLEAPNAEIIDATGMIISPGFVDTHRHVWQTQLRTVATDWSLFDYFVQMRSVYSGFYNPEDAYLGNYVGALEALNARITTIVDHCHILNSPEHSDEAVRGLKDAGCRGIFCYGLFDNPQNWNPEPSPDTASWRKEDARRIRRDALASDKGLLVFGFAPTEVTATDFETSCAEIAFARELGARRISCHVSMGAYDTGMEFVRQLGGVGLMGEDMLFVHGSTLTDDELRIMCDGGAGLSATPETELQMGMGHPVAVRAQAADVRTSLGIDIVSNYSGDMQAQMRLLLQAQRGLENSQLKNPPREIRFKAKDALRLATMGGAEVLGWENRIGSVTPGKQADLILTGCDAINMVPCLDPIGGIVLNANPSNIDTVFVAGRAVKKDGHLVNVEWQGLRDQIRQSSARIVEGFASIDKGPIEDLAATFMLGAN